MNREGGAIQAQGWEYVLSVELKCLGWKEKNGGSGRDEIGVGITCHALPFTHCCCYWDYPYCSASCTLLLLWLLVPPLLIMLQLLLWFCCRCPAVVPALFLSTHLAVALAKGVSFPILPSSAANPFRC